MAFTATFLLLSKVQNNIIISMIKRLYLIFYTFGKQLQRDNVAAYASSMAFFFLLSIIPILLIGCVILSYLPFTEDMIVAVLEEYTPGFIDNIIESLNMCKAFTIVTTQPEEISRYIMEELHHGVTMYEAEGGYTHGTKSMLLTVCRRADAFKLRKYAKQVDPDSFMIVTNSSEIIGRGFSEV